MLASVHSSLVEHARELLGHSTVVYETLMLLTVAAVELLGLWGLKFHRMQLLIATRGFLNQQSNALSSEGTRRSASDDPYLMYHLVAFLRATSMLASDLASLGKESVARDFLTPIVDSLSASGLQSLASIGCMLQYVEILAMMGDLDKRWVERHMGSMST